MGNGGRPRSLHRLRGLCDSVPRREQHSNRRPSRSGARPRDALDSRRAVLGRRVPRCPREVPACALPAMRQRAVRARLPYLCKPSHRGGTKRSGVQPLHWDALLRQCVFLQRAILQLLQSRLGKTLAPPVESRCLGARSGRDGKMHVLRPAHQCIQTDGRCSTTAAQGRRDSARVRPVVHSQRAGVWRFERCGERSVAPGALAPRQQAA